MTSSTRPTSPLTGAAGQITTRLAVGVSVLALLLSGWTLVRTVEDGADQRRIESRLACLELPGPNDCGLDR